MGMPWKVYPDKYFWDEVEYVLDGVTLKTRTTLPVLYEYVLSNFSIPEKVFVIVQETAVVRDVGLDSDYDLLERVIKDTYAEFLRSLGINNFELIVAPGCGKFLNSSKSLSKDGLLNILVDVCGTPTDYYYYIFMKLSLILASLIKEKSIKDLTIHFDISHGVNYVVTLTRIALNEILPIIATYAGLKKIVLRTYNSEPVMRKTIQVIPKGSYTIHNIENVIIKSNGNYGLVPIFECIKDKLRLLTLNNIPCIKKVINDLSSLGKEISRISNEVINELGLNDVGRLNAFVGSLINGLPLLTLMTIPTTDLKSFVEKVLKNYRELIHTNIKREGDNLIINVVKRARMTEHTKVLTKILLTKELIGSRVGSYDYEEGISLRELGNVISILYDWNERLKTVLSFDYHSLLETVENLRRIGLSTWTLLARIPKSDKPYQLISERDCEEELNKSLDRFERNFLQHSGLHRCLTEVRVDGRVRYVKDLPEDILKRIYNIAMKGLNMI